MLGCGKQEDKCQPDPGRNSNSQIKVEMTLVGSFVQEAPRVALVSKRWISYQVGSQCGPQVMFQCGRLVTSLSTMFGVLPTLT